MEHTFSALCSVLVAWSALGCGSDDEPAQTEHDPGEHACEHVSEPGTVVTASADRAAAPEIARADEPYTVMLASGQPSFVKVTGGEDALLFTKATGVVTGLFFEQETTNQLTSAEPNASCPNDIPEHFDLELDASGSWYVQLGPSVTAEVWIALTEATGHGH